MEWLESFKIAEKKKKEKKEAVEERGLRSLSWLQGKEGNSSVRKEMSDSETKETQNIMSNQKGQSTGGFCRIPTTCK